MKINNDLVERIIAKAKTSHLGLDEEALPVSLERYNPSDNSFALAAALVNSFHEKYDLVSILQATIDIISSFDACEEEN